MRKSYSLIYGLAHQPLPFFIERWKERMRGRKLAKVNLWLIPRQFFLQNTFIEHLLSRHCAMTPNFPLAPATLFHPLACRKVLRTTIWREPDNLAWISPSYLLPWDPHFSSLQALGGARISSLRPCSVLLFLKGPGHLGTLRVSGLNQHWPLIHNTWAFHKWWWLKWLKMAFTGSLQMF